MGLTDFMRQLDESMQEMVPPELKMKGWKYWDMYKHPTPEVFYQLLDCFGKEDHQILAMTQTSGSIRAQFFVSPEALQRLDANPELKEQVV